MIAASLGAVIGLERERSNQPAGLRTHIILVVGSALAMTLSINISMQFQPMVPNGDPGRLAVQVVLYFRLFGEPGYFALRHQH